MRFGNTMPLKYLFTATFEDGTIIAQPANDASVLNPQKRSAYYDVEETRKTKKLVRFELRCIESGPARIFAVDMTDGHFEVNGVVFFMHGDEQLGELRPVFFRRHTHTFTHGGAETSHSMSYNLGWQCDIAGKEHTKVLKIF